MFIFLVQSLQRDLQTERESKAKQADDLNKVLGENTEALQNEFEEKVGLTNFRKILHRSFNKENKVLVLTFNKLVRVCVHK